MRKTTFLLLLISANTMGQQMVTTCGELSDDNQVYLLDQNLQATDPWCIQITADSATLDCQGHSISGTGTETGIHLLGAHGTSVLNCDLTDLSIGVSVNDSSGASISDCEIDTVDQMGITAAFADSLVVRNNTVLNITNAGNFATGIRVYDSSDVLIQLNEVGFSGGRGIFVRRSPRAVIDQNQVHHLTFPASGGEAIEVWHSDHAQMINNTVYDIAEDCLEIAYSRYVTMSGNQATNCGTEGLCLFSFAPDEANVTEFALIENNTILNSPVGIILIGSDNNVVRNNRFEDVGLAIRVSDSLIYPGGREGTNNLFENNTIIDCGGSIYGCIFFRNVQGNTVDGALASSVQARNDADNTLLSVYYDLASEDVDATSAINRQWRYTAVVVDESGWPIQGATVTVLQSNGLLVSQMQTGEDGRTSAVPLLEYRNQFGVRTFQDPYSISVEKPLFTTIISSYDVAARADDHVETFMLLPASPVPTLSQSSLAMLAAGLLFAAYAVLKKRPSAY